MFSNGHAQTRKGKDSENRPSPTQESNEKSASSSGRGKKPVVINCPKNVYCVAFLVDGARVLSGGYDEKIRPWRVEDGREVGTPMNAGSRVLNIGVSQDGKWVAGGTHGGQVQVWNAKTCQKANEFQGHSSWVNAIDVSPDAKKITTGSDDGTVRVWSLSTGQQLLGPWEHDSSVAAARFSPDGRLVATATWQRDSVRIYHAQDGHLIVNAAVQVNSACNNSLAWASDGQRLFALCRDGNIRCLNTSTGKTLSKWAIHGTQDHGAIALAGIDTLIAASCGSSVSLWDTVTREQIGSVIQCVHNVWCMALSDNFVLAAGGNKSISLRNIRGMLPRRYVVGAIAQLEDTVQELPIQPRRPEKETCVSDVARLKSVIQRLRDELSSSQRAAEKAITALHSQETKANVELAQLRQSNEELRGELASCKRTVDGQNETIRSLRSEQTEADAEIAQLCERLDSCRHAASEQKEKEAELLRSHGIKANDTIADLQRANQKLQSIICAHEQTRRCEALHAQGRMSDAAQLLLKIQNTMNEHIKASRLLSNWLSMFTGKCIKTLKKYGDKAWATGNLKGTAAAYASAMSLSPSSPSAVLAKWACVIFAGCSVAEVFDTASKRKVSRFDIFRTVCTILKEDGRLMHAVEIFRLMQVNLSDNPCIGERCMQWKRDFRAYCAENLLKLGDAARDAREHGNAMKYYSDALSLRSTNSSEILLRRSNELIVLDPSSHIGYEQRHAALHNLGRYTEAFEAFELMVSKLEQSPEPRMRELCHQYIDVTSTIQNEVEEAIRHFPTVLIDADTGRLYDKVHQAAAFEELPIYDELRSSMTAKLDLARIQAEVKEFYRYVMFSHKWQQEEPTFQQVENTSIYELPLSPTFDKLRNFCKLVVALRFKWAWSDTCCVNQLDKGVQQESIVAMFKWYRHSSLTIVHLLGVLSEFQEPGCLWRSIWNTRGWTYQEYVASNVVQFYTEDWKPYLGLQIYNHKESSLVFSEMERATNITTRQLSTLQPGLGRAREKLYLASRRKTTREEDMAYSLFGIFNVALPVVYGEGNLAIGRFLEHILTRSDDVTLLAWTGRSSSHHSYLPAELTVYDQITPPHVPSPMDTTDMDNMVSALRISLSKLSLAISMYQRLNELPLLSLVAGRLRLPGIMFPVANLSSPSAPGSELHVYRATAPMLENLEIRTRDELSGVQGLLLVHPWIGPLLDRDFARGIAQFDLATRALRLMVQLGQPFGALLLAPTKRAQYRRVATDCLIMARVHEETSLKDLVEGIRTVDIQ